MLRRTPRIAIPALAVALLLPAGAIAQDPDTFTVTILHTNDTHAHHEPNAAGDGGAARQAAVVNQIRAEGGNVVLLDAGDRFTGTLFHQQYRGQDSVQIMNAIGYDAMTLGNHEFDDGDQVLADFIDGVHFPVVNANIDVTGSAILDGKVKPTAILEVGGEQIGIIGLTTADTPTISSPGKGLVFDADYAAVTQKAVDDLTAQGVDKIVLVTHIGLDKDKEVAAATRGVDLIVGGHSHSLLSNAYQASVAEYPVVVNDLDGAPVSIVQAGEYDQYLGRIDVTFDAAGVVTDAAGDTILLSRFITPDPTVDGIVKTLAAPIEELKQTPVGESAVFLVGDRAVCRVQECNLGNFVTDAMRAATGAQIAITNGGGIRSNVPVGAETPADVTLPAPITVTLGDVLTVFPFGNLVSTFKLTGANVIASLENGVSLVEEGSGRFPQVSGIHYTWDGSKPAGSRIVSVEVVAEDGTTSPIDPAAIYTIVSNDFMRKGGDGYEAFATNAIDPYDFGKPLDQVLQEAIKAGSPIAPMVEGRITRVDAP